MQLQKTANSRLLFAGLKILDWKYDHVEGKRRSMDHFVHNGMEKNWVWYRGIILRKSGPTNGGSNIIITIWNFKLWNFKLWNVCK